jgi:hypothetical protein
MVCGWPLVLALTDVSAVPTEPAQFGGLIVDRRRRAGGHTTVGGHEGLEVGIDPHERIAVKGGEEAPLRDRLGGDQLVDTSLAGGGQRHQDLTAVGEIDVPAHPTPLFEAAEPIGDGARGHLSSPL